MSCIPYTFILAVVLFQCLALGPPTHADKGLQNRVCLILRFKIRIAEEQGQYGRARYCVKPDGARLSIVCKGFGFQARPEMNLFRTTNFTGNCSATATSSAGGVEERLDAYRVTHRRRRVVRKVWSAARPSVLGQEHAYRCEAVCGEERASSTIRVVASNDDMTGLSPRCEVRKFHIEDVNQTEDGPRYCMAQNRPIRLSCWGFGFRAKPEVYLFRTANLTGNR
ncbi:hypothetical protein BaRGS_00028861, partial [Batillaria attramentaria]